MSIDLQMEAFMKEEVTFDNMPATHAGWQEAIEAKMKDKTCTKTVTRTVKMSDGSSQVLSLTVIKVFS